MVPYAAKSTGGNNSNFTAMLADQKHSQNIIIRSGIYVCLGLQKNCSQQCKHQCFATVLKEQWRGISPKAAHSFSHRRNIDISPASKRITASCKQKLHTDVKQRRKNNAVDGVPEILHCGNDIQHCELKCSFPVYKRPKDPVKSCYQKYSPDWWDQVYEAGKNLTGTRIQFKWIETQPHVIWQVISSFLGDRWIPS